MTRREWLRVSSGAAVTFLVGGIAGRAEGRAPGALELTVWKTPTCGCCSKWVEHMRAAGFTPKVTDLTDVTPIKRKHGVPLSWSPVTRRSWAATPSKDIFPPTSSSRC